MKPVSVDTSRRSPSGTRKGRSAPSLLCASVGHRLALAAAGVGLVWLTTLWALR